MAAVVPSKHPDCPIKTYLVSRLGMSESSHQNTLVIYRRGLYAHQACPIKTYLVSRLGMSESSHQNTLIIRISLTGVSSVPSKHAGCVPSKHP